MDLILLNEDEKKEFLRLTKLYWNKAIKCISGKAYLAAVL
jgi:hypothetical protein